MCPLCQCAFNAIIDLITMHDCFTLISMLVLLDVLLDIM